MEHYFRMIQSREKTIEGRIATERYRLFSVNDTIEFSSGNESVFTTIIGLKLFPSFEKMLQHFTIEACLPGISNMAEAVSIYHSIPGYYERESEFGVIGIQLAF